MFERWLRTASLLVLCCVLNGVVLAQSTKTDGGESAKAGTVNKDGKASEAAEGAPTGAASGGEKTEINKNPYGGAAATLFALFALAVVLESALSLLFRWRPFLRHLDGQGVKMPISLGAAWMLVGIFDLDLVTTLVKQFFPKSDEARILGPFLTAAVVAGGSSGVNKLAQALGLRPLVSAETVTPKPPPDKAWIAVRLQREEAVGEVQVLVAVDAAAPAAVGTISGNSPPSGPGWPFRDQGRFPGSGGFAVAPGKSYTITLIGRNSEGAVVESLNGQEWGPHGLLAGAIVDVSLKL